ncbi:hypothetical protein, partial [Bacteroides sp.]|uniref:hypothetical protein n=1 Tax=Bacteroides sp. TaxID=29523 RepID=UPI0026322DCC
AEFPDEFWHERMEFKRRKDAIETWVRDETIACLNEAGFVDPFPVMFHEDQSQADYHVRYKTVDSPPT